MRRIVLNYGQNLIFDINQLQELYGDNFRDYIYFKVNNENEGFDERGFYENTLQEHQVGLARLTYEVYPEEGDPTIEILDEFLIIGAGSHPSEL